MSDDEQLARVTEMARRLWPDDRIHVYVDETGVVLDGDTIAPNIRIDHPRALDAVEALLLVLLHGRQELAQALSRLGRTR